MTLDPVKLHAFIPHRRFVFTNRHIEQGFDDFEQTCQHFGRGEVLFDFLFAERITRFFELFANVRPIPRLWVGQIQVLGGKSTHISQVFFSKRAGTLA